MISLLAAILATQPAHACGGFFCSSGGSTTVTTGSTTTTQTGDYGTVPVVQDGERILFRVNGDGTLTTFVEVGFVQRDDVDFAWIIPIPDAIPVEEVSTEDAGLFNALEAATAPAFTFQWQQQSFVTNYNYNYGYYAQPATCATMGCSSSEMSAKATPGDSGFTSTTATTSTVEEKSGVAVLEDAVVGPFAIEVISAIDAPEFALWLDANGYDLPDGAIEPLQHYIDEGMSFLGVKLAPDVPEGPVDTLVFTCPADAPQIPLILTSIASANDLSINAWILADDPYVPANWATTRDFAAETLPTGGGQTDYLARVQAETGVWDGRAFVLEYAGDTEELVIDDLILNATIKQYPRITRYRGSISPWEMTEDPWFAPFPSLPDYQREHFVELGIRSGSTYYRKAQGAWLLGWLRRRKTA